MGENEVRNAVKAGEDENVVKIAILGVGGGGCNAVDNMIGAGVKVDMFMAINTDLQALRGNKAPRRIQIGKELTGGKGAGSDPERGRRAAEACKESLAGYIKDMDLIFLTAGMGGGTGTGAAPVIAEVAHNLGKLVVAFVTTPFNYEGYVRMQNAKLGIENLRKYVDAIIIIHNQKLVSVAGEDMGLQQAFKYADDVLRQGVQATADIIQNRGTINVDFADISTVLKDGGDTVMGIGCAEGPNRAIEAVKKAVNNPILDTSIQNASRAIVNIEGDASIKTSEVDTIMTNIRNLCTPKAHIISGWGVVPNLAGKVQVTVIATAFGKPPVAEAGEVPAAVAAAATEVQVPQLQEQPLAPAPVVPPIAEQPIRPEKITADPYSGIGFGAPQPIVREQAPQRRNNGAVTLDDDDRNAVDWVDRVNQKR